MSQLKEPLAPLSPESPEGADPLATAPPGLAFEEAASAYHQGLGSPGSEGPAYRPTNRSQGEDDPGSGSQSASNPVLLALDSLEVPLKAANRLLAGLPLVGGPLSILAGAMWEQVNTSAGRR